MSNIIQFSSKVLETEIKRKLGIKKDKPVTKDDIENLFTLVLTTPKYSILDDLTGLEYAVNLEFLRINNTSISDISKLATLTKLRHLNLNNNSIENLAPLKNMRILRVLSLANNQINNIAVLSKSGLLLLHANFSGNKIHDFSCVLEFPKLRTLAFDNNRLSQKHICSINYYICLLQKIRKFKKSKRYIFYECISAIKNNIATHEIIQQLLFSFPSLWSDIKAILTPADYWNFCVREVSHAPISNVLLEDILTDKQIIKGGIDFIHKHGCTEVKAKAMEYSLSNHTK